LLLDPRAPLTPDEVVFLKNFNHTRHCGGTSPLDVAAHPVDNEPTGNRDAQNRVALGMPGFWCPWTCCDDGCCLHWDGVEKPYAPEQWLTYLIETFLRPGANLARDRRALECGLTFDHVLDGLIVGERRETAELFALEVRDNHVVRRTLVPPLAGVDEWGYRSDREEEDDRATRLDARRRRFAAALAEDARRAG
jgi:hypothetical protein